jgi:hypothetical protein
MPGEAKMIFFGLPGRTAETLGCYVAPKTEVVAVVFRHSVLPRIADPTSLFRY